MLRLSIFDRESAGPRWLVLLVAALMVLFPVMLATVDGAGSKLFVVLLLLALYFGRDWGALQRWERWVLLGFVAVLLVMLLSMVNTEDYARGASQLERNLRMALIVPLYLMFRRFGWVMGAYFGFGVVLATLVMAVQGWYQVSVQERDVAIGAYHKIVFGDMAVLWGTLAILFALTYLKGWWRLAVVVLAAMAALYASVLSQTRGAWLFMPVFLLVLAWLYRRVLFADRRIQAAVAGILVLFAAALFWQAELLHKGIERGAEDLRLFMEDPSAATSWGIRLSLWRNSLLIAQESPWLGNGVGDFGATMAVMAEDGRSWTPAVAEFGHAHSIYFAALADAGILGLLAMTVGYLLLPLWAFARGLNRARSQETRFYAMGGLVTVLAFAVFGLTEGLWSRNPFVNTYVICMVWMLAGMSSLLRAETSAARA